MEERKSEIQPQSLSFSSARLTTSTLQEITTHVDLSKAHEPTKEILILKVFVTNFKDLLAAVAPHMDVLSKNLLGSLLISKESHDHLIVLKRFNIGPRERAVVVLGLLQLSITADYHCFRQLMQVLKGFPPLVHTADILKNSYSKSQQSLMVLHIILIVL